MIEPKNAQLLNLAAVATVVRQQDGKGHFFSKRNSISKIESKSQAAITSVRDNQEPNSRCMDTT